MLQYDWKELVEKGEVYASIADLFQTTPTYQITAKDVFKAQDLQLKNIEPVYSLEKYLLEIQNSTLIKLQ